MTKAEVVAALTPTINALATQMAMFTTNLNNISNNNNRNNPNSGGGPTPVVRVRNHNHTTHIYKKSEHTRESDLEYYEGRYYNKLKDDYCNIPLNFK